MIIQHCRQRPYNSLQFSEVPLDYVEDVEEFPPPVEVKMETEEAELEEIIDMTSFSDGIYICEVSLE